MKKLFLSLFFISFVMSTTFIFGLTEEQECFFDYVKMDHQYAAPERASSLKKCFDSYIASKKDIDVKYDGELDSYRGQTALMIAAQNPYGNEALEELLNHGANINERDTASGQTALMHGVSKVHLGYFLLIDKNIKLLLANPDINVNQQDYDGNTALIYATSSFKNLLLLAYGADVNIKNNDGKRMLHQAFDYIPIMPHSQMKKRLQTLKPIANFMTTGDLKIISEQINVSIIKNFIESFIEKRKEVAKKVKEQEVLKKTIEEGTGFIKNLSKIIGEYAQETPFSERCFMLYTQIADLQQKFDDFSFEKKNQNNQLIASLKEVQRQLARAELPSMNSGGGNSEELLASLNKSFKQIKYEFSIQQPIVDPLQVFKEKFSKATFFGKTNYLYWTLYRYFTSKGSILLRKIKSYLNVAQDMPKV